MAARPIDPVVFTEYGGAWPRPRLSKRATALGLTSTQWGYVLAGYTLFRAGYVYGGRYVRPWLTELAVQAWSGPLAERLPFAAQLWAYEAFVGPPLPGWGVFVWPAVCLALTAAGVVFSWHGLHAYQVAQVVWRDRTTPRVSVWRPLDLAREEQLVEEAEEDARAQRRRRQAGVAPPQTPDNPLGWVVD